MKNVTMKDIAEAMQVSVVTVSKALAGKTGVSNQNREKIIRKSQEMGYVYPGQPLSSLDNPDVHTTIGVLVADRFFKDNSFYYSMYRSIVLACAKAGFSTLLEIVTPDDEMHCVLPNFIAANKSDGVIFMGEMYCEYINSISQKGIAYTLLDFYDDLSISDSVVSDGIFGAFQLTSHLIEKGHKKIGFVGTLTATSSILDRYLGYCRALLKHGLKTRDEWILPDRKDNGRFIEIMLPDNMPEAFVCNCDEVAYAFIERLRQAGFRVPEDISVVGFDDSRFARLSVPELTTFRVDIDAMAKASLEHLLKKIKLQQYVKGRTIISGQLVIRDSVLPK